MTKAVYLGSSFVGDSLVHLATMRAIQGVYNHETIYFPILDFMEPIIQPMLKLEDSVWLHYIVDSELTNKLADSIPLVNERFEKGKVIAYYTKEQEKMYEHRFKRLDEFATQMKHAGVSTVYVGHWFFGMLYFANKCEELGMEIRGYKMKHNGDVRCLSPYWHSRDSGLYHDGFFGDKLSYMFTGSNLRPTHFYLKEPTAHKHYIPTLIMPSGRGKFPTAGNWEWDIHMVCQRGYRPQVVIWAGDLDENLYNSLDKALRENGIKNGIVIVEDFKDTIQYVYDAEHVITNDSGQFHVAWLLGKKVLVKQKDYMFDKWIPPQRLRKEYIITVPPVHMFPSDYVNMMDAALDDLYETYVNRGN